MRDALREIIFDDADIAGAEALRKSVVSKTRRLSSAKQKDATRLTPEGLPVQSFQDLLKDMGTMCRNRIEWNVFHQRTESTPLQRRTWNCFPRTRSQSRPFLFEGLR